jgi:RNA polymerase sigma-70 factor, ECF subfamily
MIGLRLDPAIRPRVDASDVVQEVLLEASRRLAEYLRAPAMPFHLWLRHIARDHVIDAHRRHRQAQRRTVDREHRMDPRADASSLEFVHQLLDHELTPATAALRQEIQGRFQSALEALPEDDREIILMRHFEQLSNQDVASALALTEAAASMRYLRALRRLRALLLLPSDSQAR